MWSNLYVYYHLQSNERHQEFHSVEDITQILTGTGVLELKLPMTFGNIADFPWLEVSIVQATDGNYSISEDANYKKANLLAVVTSKQYDQQIYKDLLIEIARALQWDVILEEDEDENENVIIFSPDENM